MAIQTPVSDFVSGEGSGGPGPYGGATSGEAVRLHLNALIDAFNNHLLTLRQQIDAGEVLTLYDEEIVSLVGGLSGAGSVAGSGTIQGISLPLPLADGGTGGIDAVSGRSGLGLGTMAIQNAAAVAITGGSILGVSFGVANPTYGATVSPDAAAGRYQIITVTNTTAFTVAAPANPTAGKLLIFEILNNSGGAMGAITWNAAFLLAGAFTNPASTKRRAIEFAYNGTNWVEISRAAADI